MVAGFKKSMLRTSKVSLEVGNENDCQQSETFSTKSILPVVNLSQILFRCIDSLTEYNLFHNSKIYTNGHTCLRKSMVIGSSTSSSTSFLASAPLSPPAAAPPPLNIIGEHLINQLNFLEIFYS